MDGADIPIAYCGAPPTIGTLAGRWIFDPLLIVVLVGVAALYLWSAHRAGAPRRARALFLTGWAVATLALISPLCALSVSLFSARVGQHLALALVAAPLIAAAHPAEALFKRGGAPVVAAIVFAVAIWLWHAPGPYAATFRSDALYWAMHLSIGATAVWLWRAILAPGAAPAQAFSATLFSTVQMSLLGALITFAPRPFYTPHLATTQAWGLTPLGDQQLGGALMWGPGCAVFLLAAAAALIVLTREERAVAPGR